MKITFDPTNLQEREDVQDILDIYAAPVQAQTAAPTAPMADTAVPIVVDQTAGVELDANGTPWVADVHATTKTQTKAGVWKGKRGGDKDELAAAEQAARDKIAGAPTPVVPTEPVVPAADQAAPVITMDDVSRVWQDALAADVVDAAGIMTIYGQIGVDPSQLNTNETMRASFYNHLAGLLAPQTPVGIPGMPG